MLVILLLYLCTMTSCLIFGTLETKIVPLSPNARLLYTGTQGHTRGFVYLVTPSRVLVCCDNECNIHYFMQSNDNLSRALWTAPVNQYEKGNIFKELREWYASVTKKDLCSTMIELDDKAAWEASEGPCDI